MLCRVEARIKYVWTFEQSLEALVCGTDPLGSSRDLRSTLLSKRVKDLPSTKAPKQLGGLRTDAGQASCARRKSDILGAFPSLLMTSINLSVRFLGIENREAKLLR
jgi:hypothetical protein